MFWGHRDDAGVPPLGPQDVGSREDPKLRQQGPRTKPAALWDAGQILHTEQNLPRKQTGPGTATSHDPFHLRGKSAGHAAAGWTDTELCFTTICPVGCKWDPCVWNLVPYLANSLAAWSPGQN